MAGRGGYSGSIGISGQSRFDPRPRQRSRPGAPMHDPTSNIPIGGLNSTSLTPQSNWDNAFRPHLSSILQPLKPATPGVPGAPAPGVAPVPPGGATPPISPGVTADEQFGGGTNPAPTPSLAEMAAGGPSHAQRWSSGTPNPLAGTGYQTGDPAAIFQKYHSPFMSAVDTPPAAPSYGWGAAFQQPDQES